MALEGSYAKKAGEGSTAAVADISAGGNLALSTGGDARLEGARLKAGGDADVNVKGDLKFDAARDTSRSESLSAEGSLKLGASSEKDMEKEKQTDAGNFGFSAKGQYEKKSGDKAVTGGVSAGGATRLRAGGDAVLEGTDLRAGDEATVSAGRDLALKAATDTAETMKFSGELALGAGSKTVSTLGKDGATAPDNTADTRKGALDLSGDYEKSESRRGVTVQAGAGGAQLAAGRDLAMQGGSVKSGGDVALTAAGDMSLGTATSTANSIGGSLNAAQATTRNTVSTDKDESEGKKGAGIRGGINENHQGTAINSGGQVVLKSGGATSMTNTETAATRGVVTEAGKGVSTNTVKDRNEVLNLGVSSKNSSAGAPLAKEAAPAWTPASPSKDSTADAGNGKAQGPAIGAARAKAGKPAGHKPAPKKPVKQAKPVIGEARKAAAPLP
jgi:filamentous hemagglutinin